jgi:hypothetical protein
LIRECTVNVEPAKESDQDLRIVARIHAARPAPTIAGKEYRDFAPRSNPLHAGFTSA